mmetsp:Transcript_1784/g.3178  ORF Transcript_1784/g.3178 Transcript_1784/m.3178 type:complete len:206 (+) Transcript_1784:3158-3775(+)
MKGANHVFSEGMVHSRLASHTGIHHRHHRRGNLYKVYSPLVNGSRKPDHVANYPTTESHKGAFPIQFFFQSLIKNPLQDFHTFVFFAIGQNQSEHFFIILFLSQQIGVFIQVHWSNSIVGDDQSLAAMNMRRQHVGNLFVRVRRADVNGVVSSVGQIHLDNVVIRTFRRSGGSSRTHWKRGGCVTRRQREYSTTDRKRIRRERHQ